jgi:propionyl-CoA synthetase
MDKIYGASAGDVFWAASDIGWVVGHSYIVYGPLLAGCTTVLYEGKPVGTPDAGAFWRVVDEHQVNILFAAPTAVRAIKKEDPDGAMLRGSSRGSLRRLYTAGERLDAETYEWANRLLGIPVIDHWWQTETGWPIAANPIGIEALPIKPGSPTVPMPGYDVQVLDAGGQPVPAGTEGVIAIRLPLPPGALSTLWNDDERYVASYLTAYPGYYATGDGGYLDEDGYLFVMGRTDDVINVAGHRLSTGVMEDVVARHPAVAECAVLGLADELKGELPVAFVVLKARSDVVDPQAIEAEIVAMVRDQIGPVASFKRAIVVPALPKTRSGKILRKSIRAIAERRDEPVPATVDDASVLDQLREVLAESGI